MFEVEIRGELTSEKREKLLTSLNEKSKKKYLRRLLLDYSTFIDDHGVVGRETDIRVRITNNLGEIILKKGAFGGASRSEVSLEFTGDQFLKSVNLMAEFGYKKAMACIREIYKFKLELLEYSIVTIPKYGYFYEVEGKARNEMESKEIESNIKSICNNLGLHIFSTEKKEFENYVEKLNKEANYANWIFEFPNNIDELNKSLVWVEEYKKN